jgi:predicted dehydrogenase
VHRFDSWESLLDQQRVDVVVVARAADQDRRAEQLRKLIQVGVPVLVSHPVVDSMLVYYELDMIRRDTGSLEMPYLPARHHPAVTALRGLADANGSGDLGRIEQVVMERAVPSDMPHEVVCQFARDVDLIRAVAGDMTRLGAMATDALATSYAGLGVQMSGTRGVTARWSVDPMLGSYDAQLSVLGNAGKAIVRMASPGRPWILETRLGGAVQEQAFDGVNLAADALVRLHAALASSAVEPDWVDAARAVELSETISRSIAKSRTIELYYEDYTEEGTFKGTMTSVGCGLLIVGMFLLGLVAIADQIGLPFDYVRHWPKALVGLLGIFLLLQLLMLVFPRSAGTATGQGPPDSAT